MNQAKLKELKKPKTSQHDAMPELSEVGAAQLAAILKRPPRKIPRLAALFARKKP